MARTYAELNTNLNTNQSTLIDQLNGRQGDANREVFFQIKDGTTPYNLEGKTIALFAKDAQGVIKATSTINDQTGISVGRFSMIIPKEFYQASGAVEDAYIQISYSDKVISTIPVSFQVIANTMLVTQTQSQIFIDSVQNLIDDTNQRLSTTTTSLTAVENAVEALKVTIGNLNDQYNADLFAKKANDNEFKGVNTFDQKIIAPNGLEGKADSATQADTLNQSIDQTVQSITAKNWSTFQSGLESFSGFKSHGWANLDYAAIAGNIDADGDVNVKGKIKSSSFTKYIEIGKLNATISRFGNVVFISIDTQKWPYDGATAWTVAYDMVIPAGYRPVGTASMTIINNYKMSSLKVNSNGAIFFTDTDVSSSTNFEAYGTWITNDDWAN